MQAIEVEREAFRRLPALLAELFDEPSPGYSLQRLEADRGIDAVVDAGGRHWFLQVKASSSPGSVAAAADQLEALQRRDGIAVLVVPHMTPAGAKAAEARGLNWLDLSGNASLRDEDLYVWVQGRPNQFVRRGRPASAFAPKSSRVARVLLLDPERWWLQKELSERTDLDPAQVSRVVRRLEDDQLLKRDGSRVRPRDPDLLLDAWTDEYRFDRHDIVSGHRSGSGIELARELSGDLRDGDIDHALTGLAAAWVFEGFARFRLISVYVHGDPRDAADVVGLRRNDRGANVQLLGPDDRGVFDGQEDKKGLPCVSRVQTYLDLRHLPERAGEAAEELRADGKLWTPR